jgi:hypothetical protein
MITADCDSIRDDLDGYVDGELRGAELRRVADHVETCRRCAEEIESRRELGGLIRESVADAYQVPVSTGLAAGVVARVRAESYFSWRAVLSRGIEDWHWIIVGGGAVAATFVCMLFCSAILLMGTASHDANSLSAMGKNLQTSPGRLYAEVSRQGSDENVILVQLDGMEYSESSPNLPLSLIMGRSDEERQYVEALGAALLRKGAFVELAAMPEGERRYAEWLLDNIARIRRQELSVGPMGPLTVRRLHLVTDVTTKALN